MKTFIIAALLLITNLTFGQTKVFYSDGDVLEYLTIKGSFSNRENGVRLTFNDMATYLSSNKGVKYFSPEVKLVSRTSAIVVYQSLTSSNGIAKIYVDTKLNVIMDVSSNTVYYSEYDHRSKAMQ